MGDLINEPIGIGELIRRLREVPGDFFVCIGGVAWLIPTCEIASYRGYYEQAALEYTLGPYSESSGLNVAKLINALRGAIGKTYPGYKGGEYVFDDTTAVWVSNHRDVTNLGVIGVSQTTGVVSLDVKRF